MLASGRLSASTLPAYCRSINRPKSHRQPCPAAPAVLVSPSSTPIPPRKATGRRLDPTSSNLTPRPNPHRPRGTDGAHSPRFRALALFRRRHPSCWLASSWPASENLHKRGLRGYPVATVALYGPDDTRATKLTVGIVPAEDA